MKGMADRKLRQHITCLAAQLMYEGQETEYYTAKRKAARMLGLSERRSRPQDLPSNREIREQILHTAALMEDRDERHDRLRDMRLEAVRLMRMLEAFHPVLIGSVWTGHVRHGSDIDLHVFTNDLGALEGTLEDEGLEFDVEHKRVLKHGEERLFTHVHLQGRYPFELTVYTLDKRSYVFKSSITGKAMERATLPQLEAFVTAEYALADLDAALVVLEDRIDPFDIYRMLLRPLANVEQDPEWHPEGEALYHSLQVFEEARARVPYDADFLLAALLHDVGKAIDPRDHVAAGLEALEGVISERTAFLIAHHMDAHGLVDGSLGVRKRRRLVDSEYYDDLVALQECDVAGRKPGRVVCELEEALDFIRELYDG
jgi:predicted nucleotidyltransferase